MKQRDTLKKLTERQPTVEWPGYNPNFDTFRSQLRKVIEANLGRHVAESLDYCLSEQKFYITLKIRGLLGGVWADHLETADHGTALALTRTFEIDPEQPIGEQVNAAIKAQQHLEERHGLLRSLLDIHLGKEA
ncbi:MAG: hypothetical protein ACYS7Y_33490 [Planctomycetota bacterium]|jgi:hypothetical protein